MRDVFMIGSGCAGNTVAIYAARAKLKPLAIGGHEAGGRLSHTRLVENSPSFPEGINGPGLVEDVKLQAAVTDRSNGCGGFFLVLGVFSFKLAIVDRLDIGGGAVRKAKNDPPIGSHRHRLPWRASRVEFRSHRPCLYTR
jgi:hypothetical protein